MRQPWEAAVMLPGLSCPVPPPPPPPPLPAARAATARRCPCSSHVLPLQPIWSPSAMVGQSSGAAALPFYQLFGASAAAASVGEVRARWQPGQTHGRVRRREQQHMPRCPAPAPHPTLTVLPLRCTCPAGPHPARGHRQGAAAAAGARWRRRHCCQVPVSGAAPGALRIPGRGAAMPRAPASPATAVARVWTSTRAAMARTHLQGHVWHAGHGGARGGGALALARPGARPAPPGGQHQHRRRARGQ